LNTTTKKKQIFFSHSGGGIGAVCVHPSKKYYAVGEKGRYPCIFIYEYPSLKLYRILVKGTEAAYANINFSQDGEQIVSLGSYPDFQITIWDWKKQQMVLKAKANSLDVNKAAFS